MTRTLRLSFVLAITLVSLILITCGDDDPVGPTEPTEDLYTLGLERTNWTLASLPGQLEGNMTYRRGTMRWHNPPPISREEVYSDVVAPGEGALYPMRLIFRPHGRVPVGPVDDPCFMLADMRSWSGIMRLWNGKLPSFSSGAYGYYLKIRAKGGKGILNFDIGRINENIDGDGMADNEDVSLPPNGTIDYDPGSGINEDTGLDGLLDLDEVGRCGTPYDPVTNPDPAGDNWWYEGYGKGNGNDNEFPPVPQQYRNDPVFVQEVHDASHWRHYEWMNGTEGNHIDYPVQGMPDMEDLNGNGLDIIDAYLSYRIDLNTEPSNPYLIQESERNGWFTYLIPLWARDSHPDTIRSHPALEMDWKYFTHMRIWFDQPVMGMDSLADMDSLWIADWRIVAE